VSRLPRCLVAVACAAAIVASPSLAVGRPSVATRVAGELFPSNRLTVRDRTQRTGLRVALPRPACAARPSDCQDIDVLNRLDGFNLQPRISVPFTGPIDVASVSSRDVFFVRLGGHGHGGARAVGIGQIVWDPATNTLHAESDALLDQDRRYALVVTTGVRDASGAPIAARRGSSHHGERVAAVSVFTTQSATAVMERIRRQLDARAPSPASFDLGPGGERTVFAVPAITSAIFNRQLRTTGPLSPTPVPIVALNVAPGAVGELAFGTYRSPDYETAAGEIPAVGTRRGIPAVQSESTLAFNLVVPSGTEPAGGWPVAIFGHGIGDNKNSSPFAVAATLARAGIATIAINVVGHGFGPAGTLTVDRTDGPSVTFGAGGRAVDQDANGTFDSTEGVSAVAPDAIISNRDGLNQTVIDLMALVRTIRAGVDIDGDGRSDLSTSRISYYGQSFGGIYGTELLGLDPEVHTGAVNVPGGPMIEIARLSPAFRPLVQLALGARTPPLLNGGFDGFTEDIPLRGEPPITNPAPGATAIQEVLDHTEWVSQSSNPVAWAPHLRRDRLPGVGPRQVIVQFARGDQTVANPTASALIRAGGLRDRATFLRSDLAFAADPTFPKNPHAFLTRIAGPPPLAAQVALEAQQQIATFLASDGATTIDPDGAGPLFETPIAGPLPEDLGFIP
jgi:hypothetical protein